MIDYFKKNWLAIIGTLIGVIGIILSYYFYTMSIKSREPVFIVTKHVSLFSSPKGLSSEYLKLVKRSDGTELLKNVYILEVAVWNNGRESIRKDNILMPLSLYFDGELEIIDAFISEHVRPDIVQGTISFEPGGNSIGTDFYILEKNDGFKVQIVYAANEEASVSLKGTIEGVDAFKSTSELSSENFLSSTLKVLVIAIAAIAVILALAFIGDITKWIFKKVLGRYSDAIYSVVSKTFASVFAVAFLALITFVIYKISSDFAEETAVLSVPQMTKVASEK